MGFREQADPSRTDKDYPYIVINREISEGENDGGTGSAKVRGAMRGKIRI